MRTPPMPLRSVNMLWVSSRAEEQNIRCKDFEHSSNVTSLYRSIEHVCSIPLVAKETVRGAVVDYYSYRPSEQCAAGKAGLANELRRIYWGLATVRCPRSEAIAEIM